MRTETTFRSRDGKTDIHVVTWLPAGEPVAVVQLVHGMAEHILRYEPFALYLAEHGILGGWHDHLGRGLSVTERKRRGSVAAGDAKGWALSLCVSTSDVMEKDSAAR